MKKQILLFLLTTPVFAQPLSVGVQAGVPLLARGVNSDQSRPYLVGSSVELRLPAGFALEAGALYQRIGNGSTGAILTSVILPDGTITSAAPLTYSNRSRGNSWEFPLVGKYYFRRRAAWQPFVGTGWAFRTVHYETEGIQPVPSPDGTLHPVAYKFHATEPLGTGAVVAAGVRLRTGHFTWLPEFRYTRWGGRSTLTRANEAGLLLGLRF